MKKMLEPKDSDIIDRLISIIDDKDFMSPEDIDLIVIDVIKVIKTLRSLVSFHENCTLPHIESEGCA